ncbi:hypothetical protein QE152_g19222 [Popillia japonica]|uniref:Uncharacterized protein n=1 Tax=Popillia japonica TaxID=7064 RepID=A0AAW1KT20_POPJA
MGKRSGEVINPNIEDILEEVQRQQLEEDNPDVVFTGSRNDYSNKHQENEQRREQDLYNLSPLIRQWLRSIRNVQALRSTNLD